MSDQLTGQEQEVQTSPTSDNGNRSQPPSHATGIPLSELKQPSTRRSAQVEPITQPSFHKSTAPRTPQGEQRSKFNAHKHGIFSKSVLLQDESRTEYDALLNGLMEDLQPRGKLETVLVENLSTLLWRKRRLLQAATAEIEKSQFLNWELTLQKLKGASDTKVGISKPLNVLRNAMGILYIHVLLSYAKDDGDGIRQILKTIYGYQEEGPESYGWRQMWLLLSKLLFFARQGKEDTENPADTNDFTDDAISEEMIRLSMLYDAATAVEALRREHNLAGARVPPQEVSDRLLRYEAHLSREFDRTLSQLERLQRLRKGQPILPPVKFDLSL